MSEPPQVPPAERWQLRSRRLYLCTPDRPDLGAFVAECIEGGVDVVQLRDKQLGDDAILHRCELLLEVCGARRVPFVLNDRPDLARRAGADGVHVGQDDPDPAAARNTVGPGALVGLSTHAVDELERARDGAAPVDYVSAGPVVPTPTKPGRPGTGPGYVAEAVARSPWPVWITGGVTPDTVPELVGAGASHFVAVRWLTEAAEPRAAARRLRLAIDRALGSEG
ncbi:MAG: thiamine phosphate synthase [Acidimicrobiales bacterium]|nr:thiamine phosphate synthase [Acidimicrobiales bacterium]